MRGVDDPELRATLKKEHEEALSQLTVQLQRRLESTEVFMNQPEVEGAEYLDGLRSWQRMTTLRLEDAQRDLQEVRAFNPMLRTPQPA